MWRTGLVDISKLGSVDISPKKWLAEVAYIGKDVQYRGQ